MATPGCEKFGIVVLALCSVREGSVKKPSSALNSSRGWYTTGDGLKLRLPRT